ncbi:hypothetical protein, conserved [Eimeria praecox]|uniref:Cyclin, N-terminal domain-containing protein n=1 Tax=Eimeria praecox TaxID=51316 RepID=U6H3H9_9EIME|nr:hypothetical protein, conserved [Eimeria praecox]
MEASVVPLAPQDGAIKCGCTEEQLLMQQGFLQQQQMLQQHQLMLQQQQQEAFREEAVVREQELQQEQRQNVCKQQQEHRQQPQQQPQKGYSTCGGEEGVLPAGPLFVEKMSLLMEQLATCGDESCRRPSVATRFDSICPPATSIAAYIPRLYRHFRCSEEVFVFALIYLDRVIRANHIKINALNIHRLVLAASVIGVKFVEDVRYSNRYYARVGGVGLTELNRLELAFLKLVKFDLTVSKEEYAVYRSTVLLACPKRPVPNALPAETQQQQPQQPQQHMGAPDVVPTGIDTSIPDCGGPSDQRPSLDGITPSVQQGQPQTLVQQQQQEQQQQQCSRGLVAASTASTVSTTPEAGPPHLPAGSSCGSAAGAVAGAVAVGAPIFHQQQQFDRSVECLQRTEVLPQEEAVIRSHLQQQWQSCGLQYVGAYEQQQRQALQQTRLMIEAQIQQQQETPKQQSRLCSQERLIELQQQHHRQLIRAQQLLLLREYHQQQQLLLEQQQQQQLLLLRQQQQLLLLQEGDFMMKEAAMSPSNSFAPTSRCHSRDSLSLCGGFGVETEDKMTTAASDEEVASPMNGLRDVLTAEVP